MKESDSRKIDKSEIKLKVCCADSAAILLSQTLSGTSVHVLDHWVTYSPSQPSMPCGSLQKHHILSIPHGLQSACMVLQLCCMLLIPCFCSYSPGCHPFLSGAHHMIVLVMFPDSPLWATWPVHFQSFCWVCIFLCASFITCSFYAFMLVVVFNVRTFIIVCHCSFSLMKQLPLPTWSISVSD